MKVSKEQMAENRERIVDTAAQLFRERGFDGIGVADLMKAAGFTHGGFYGHFASKDDLMAQAAQRVLEQSHGYWSAFADATPGDPAAAARALETAYLSQAHCAHPGQGCLFAALGSEAARQGPAVRAVVTAGLRSMVDRLATLMPGRSKAARRQRALADYAALVGAMVLARAVDDPALSEEVLDATARALGLERGASAPQQ